MDENHQNTPNNNLAATQDVEWVRSKKSKLFIPQHKNPRRRTFKVPFDWLNFIGVFLIPFVVTVIGLYATQQLTQQQAQASERQHQTDLQIANDQQLEAALQTYLDRMSDLLLNNKLSTSKQGDVVRDVARARTLEALSRLDRVRKGVILQFLDETGLIRKDTKIIGLWNADFNDLYLPSASLNFTYLSEAHFSHANLNAATINDSDLSNADLSYADLRYVEMNLTNLEFVDLHGADLHSPDAVINPKLAGGPGESTLDGSNLFGADLSYTDLRYVNFKDANLQYVDLSYANLKGALVTYEQLAQTESLKGTIMPDGSKHP